VVRKSPGRSSLAWSKAGLHSCSGVVSKFVRAKESVRGWAESGQDGHREGQELNGDCDP